jgi:23S rRNA pseudouridine1911/1915/1917 synthase
MPAGVSPVVREAVSSFGRQALHAARLTLTHPKSGKEVSFESPLPKDFGKLLKVLEESESGA